MERTMTRTIDVGAFIPVGNHGWIHSVNSPAVEDGSYQRNLEITQRAEALGFDLVLSPGIWRGRKGPSEHWMECLESLTASAGLLEATRRIQVFATLHMTVYPPAIIAKMASTLDQIGPGRVGLNLVTGSSFLDLSHVGLWRDGLSHDERYDLADEWVGVARRLWSEDVVSHKGEFYELVEATMGPKPSRMPRLANAGASDRGLEFAVQQCDIAFVGAGDGDDPKYTDAGKRAKEMARTMNKPDLKAYGQIAIVPGETDEEAQARLNHFNEGVDVECMEDIIRGYSMNPDAKSVTSTFGINQERPSSVLQRTMTGSYQTLAKRIANTVHANELDGVIFIVPDYVKDLEAVAKKTMTAMVDYGVDSNVGRAWR
jgi:pyrimidine oxygenase